MFRYIASFTKFLPWAFHKALIPRGFMKSLTRGLCKAHCLRASQSCLLSGFLKPLTRGLHETPYLGLCKAPCLNALSSHLHEMVVWGQVPKKKKKKN